MKILLIAFIAFCLGALFGVVIMCLLQIGKDDRFEETCGKVKYEQNK